MVFLAIFHIAANGWYTLITDHNPITTIFGAKKAIPTLAAARWVLQYWFTQQLMQVASTLPEDRHGDAHSEWPEVIIMSSAIYLWEDYWSSLLLLCKILWSSWTDCLSHNLPPWSLITSWNNMESNMSRVYHPSTNRFVQTFKSALIESKWKWWMLTYKPTQHVPRKIQGYSSCNYGLYTAKSTNEVRFSEAWNWDSGSKQNLTYNYIYHVTAEL